MHLEVGEKSNKQATLVLLFSKCLKIAFSKIAMLDSNT